MSSLSRYKKSGGFLQLLSLLETFGPAKKDKFVEMIEGENAAWAQALREKMLSLDRIFQWPDQVIIEIFKSLPIKNMAVAFFGLKEEQRAKIAGFFSASEQRKMQDTLGDGVMPKPEEVSSNAVKVIEITRKLISEGQIRPDKFDEGLLIPEDFESKLDSSNSSQPALNFSAADKLGSVVPANNGSAGDAPNSHEAMQLQRLVTKLSQENKALKDEVKIMSEKLAQIKRIA